MLIPDDGEDSYLDVDNVLMLAWIMPAQLDVSADRGIIMNKESVYEYGLQDNSGVLQGAFSPCWRWWGSVSVPIEEWTHVGAGVDGTHERHFVNGDFVEETDYAGEMAHNDNFRWCSWHWRRWAQLAVPWQCGRGDGLRQLLERGRCAGRI